MTRLSAAALARMGVAPPRVVVPPQLQQAIDDAERRKVESRCAQLGVETRRAFVERRATESARSSTSLPKVTGTATALSAFDEAERDAPQSEVRARAKVAKQGRAAKARPVSEQVEQERVVEALRLAGVLHFAVPNGGGRSGREGAALQRAGVVAGIPDVLIVDPPPAHPGKVGFALEMKTAERRPTTTRAGRFSGARPEQREWLERLEARGWCVAVAYGAEDAMSKLAAAGYPMSNNDKEKR